MFKKLLISFLLGLTVLFSFAPYISPIKAQAADLWTHQWYAEANPLTWYAKVYDTTNPSEIFGERYTAAQVQWVFYGFISMLLNLIPGNPELLICVTNASGDPFTACSAVITKITDTMGITYAKPTNSTLADAVNTVSNGPVSGIGYVKNLANKFSLVGTAKAQGFGFTTVGSSVQGLWKITRDISFGLLVIAIIVLAFMIMFRVKISPQATINLQIAIPKIVIALILITFSYAIAGFVIDLMYVIIGVIATILSSTGLTGYTNPVDMFNELTTENGAFSLIYTYWIDLLIVSFSLLTQNVLIGIFLALFAIILIIMVVFWSIKIVFVFVKTFATLMLTIILGPLEILAGTVVASVGFTSWLKKLFAQVMVFPVMGIMFFFAFFFLVQGGNTATGSAIFPFKPTVNMLGAGTWQPPLSTFNGLGGPGNTTGAKLIWIIVSILIFSNITKVAEIVQSAIYGTKFNFGTELAAGTSTTLKLAGGTTESIGRAIPNSTVAGIGGALQQIGQAIH